MLKGGLSVRAVARRVGASAASVSRWQQAFHKGGKTALSARPIPGRPSRISASTLQRLLKILSKGAAASGFSDGVWTLERVSKVIRREFKVKYHPSHVWRILRRAGWRGLALKARTAKLGRPAKSAAHHRARPHKKTRHARR